MQLLEFLLDSDVMIDILRDYDPAVEWLKALRDNKGNICLPGFAVKKEYLMMPLHAFNTRHFRGAFIVDTVQPYKRNYH